MKVYHHKRQTILIMYSKKISKYIINKCKIKISKMKKNKFCKIKKKDSIILRGLYNNYLKKPVPNYPNHYPHRIRTVKEACLINNYYWI